MATPAVPVSVADSVMLTGPPYQPVEQAAPPQAIDVLGACVSFLTTCATVLTTVPLPARGRSQSRNAWNSDGLIEGAGSSPPQLSQMRWKTKLTQPPPLVSACVT